jgi:hypothetical protein
MSNKEPMNNNPEQNKTCQASLEAALKQARAEGVTNVRNIQLDAIERSAIDGVSCRVTPGHVQSAAKGSGRG